MSGKTPNERMHFEEPEPFMRSRASYYDDYDNEWIIELFGSQRAVDSIIRQPRIILNAIPEGHDDFPERYENAQRWADELPIKDEPEESPAETDGPPPELWVHVSLAHVASPDAFHVIDMEFDPLITPRQRHLWTFELRAKVDAFQVSVNKTAGDVYCSSWTTTTNAGTVGHAQVRYKAGNPAEYEISSHVGTYVVR